MISRDVRRTTLEEAASLITGQRAASYGDYTVEATRLGKAWAAVLGLSTDIEPHKVAAMMVVFKMLRATNDHGPAHVDNWRDAAGYAGLGAQIDVERRGA